MCSVLDPDPHGSETFAWIWIRIQLNMKEQINKNVISLSILDFEYCRTVKYEIENGKYLIEYMIEFKVVLFTISKYT